MDKEILTIADASALLALSEAEVAQLLEDGELPGRRIGPHWYISRQRLLQFIAEGDTPAPKPKPAPIESPKPIPSRVLAPNWRCEKCEAVHPPDVVECNRCGAIRNTPLMGLRLPRPLSDSQLGLGGKVN